MRAPIKSEPEAFRFTVLGVLSIAMAILLAWLTEPWIGATLFALTFLVAAVAYLRAGRADRPPVLGEAARAAHRHGSRADRRHVLVIANEALSGDELRRGVGENAEVDVLAPVLTSHVHLGVTDIDRETEEARARLERSLAWMKEHGIAARGEVGDPSPITAIADELRAFGADEVIVVTQAEGRETWQERGELERLRRELDIPVTQVATG